MIVMTNAENLSALFTGPKTADIVITKTHKRKVHFWYNGKNRVLGKYGVVTNDPCESGEFYPWDISCISKHEICEAICDYLKATYIRLHNGERLYTYK